MHNTVCTGLLEATFSDLVGGCPSKCTTGRYSRATNSNVLESSFETTKKPYQFLIGDLISLAYLCSRSTVKIFGIKKTPFYWANLRLIGR